MAAAEHERARPIEGFEEGDSLTSSARDNERHQQQRHKEDEGRCAAMP
jgi:hypothetical protein